MNVFSFKLSHLLLNDLKQASAALNKSKGTIIREALAEYLAKKIPLKERLKELTKSMNKNKSSLNTKTWESIYKKTSHQGALSPEDEVKKYRERGS